MSRRFSSAMVGLIVIAFAVLALLGSLPLDELLTEYEPLPQYRW